ncbi:VTT domain-containing protein [Streptomyces sp. NBC_01808]|uniref:TVP38/TMEM64 family protein n=1 Tax=Streptomyces sp. NBC_01808 TaxID=2975947 RepID=UPI002DDC15BD|nr:VTT domain-containing protein [Streptomyces sp. NBC_01808]WSA36247.1 VTT domain-containing protein [Streptomyces sp. NBC_01808]
MPETAEAPVAGRAVRCGRALLSPRSRLALLLVLLAGAAVVVIVWRPHRLLVDGLPPQFTGLSAVLLFAVAYGLCTAALVPRPLLNLASGTLFGAQAGLAGSVSGTVLGAGVAFGIGRLLGQDALRPLLRGRLLTAADRQLSRHSFRSMLVLRTFPGVPFAGVNYAAAVSRMNWTPFLVATAVGCVPNTAAYVIAGSRASDPLSPVFLGALGFIVASMAGGAAVAMRRRRRSGRRAAPGGVISSATPAEEPAAGPAAMAAADPGATRLISGP